MSELDLRALVPLLFSVVWPSYPLRLTIAPGLMAVVQLAHLRLVWRHDHRSFTSQFLLAWVAFSALALAVRSATAHLERADADLFTPTLLHNVYLASYAFSLLGEGIGLVLLAQQRLQEHIRELAAPERALQGAIARADAAPYQGRDHVVQTPGQFAGPAVPAPAHQAESGPAWAPT